MTHKVLGLAMLLVGCGMGGGINLEDDSVPLIRIRAIVDGALVDRLMSGVGITREDVLKIPEASLAKREGEKFAKADKIEATCELVLREKPQAGVHGLHVWIVKFGKDISALSVFGQDQKGCIVVKSFFTSNPAALSRAAVQKWAQVVENAKYAQDRFGAAAPCQVRN